MDSARCVILIPARGGSKGVPRKNIRPLDERTGETLLSRAISTAREANIGDVYVSTEDNEIAEHVLSLGAMTINRPAELATDAATTESVMLHACGILPPSRILVVFQCTAPFANAMDLIGCVERMDDAGADVSIACASTHDLLVTESSCGILTALNFSFATLTRRQERPAMFRMAGSVWAYDRASFMSRRKAYGGKIVLYETHSKTMDIDTMEDFVEVSALIQEANCVIM